MTADIKNYVSTCEACREYERGQVKETMMSPETPNRPWQPVAADLFEFEGKTYLVSSDYYSNFFELDHLRSPSSVCVIRKLKAHFECHGIPEQLVKIMVHNLRHAISWSSREIGTLNTSQAAHITVRVTERSEGSQENSQKVQSEWIRCISSFTRSSQHPACQCPS